MAPQTWLADLACGHAQEVHSVRDGGPKYVVRCEDCDRQPRRTGVVLTATSLAAELRGRAAFARDGLTGAPLRDLLMLAADRLEGK